MYLLKNLFSVYRNVLSLSSFLFVCFCLLLLSGTNPGFLTYQANPLPQSYNHTPSFGVFLSIGFLHVVYIFGLKSHLEVEMSAFSNSNLKTTDLEQCSSHLRRAYIFLFPDQRYRQLRDSCRSLQWPAQPFFNFLKHRF